MRDRDRDASLPLPIEQAIGGLIATVQHGARMLRPEADALRARIAEALAAARREALEVAAKEWDESDPATPRADIAAAIRAPIETEAGKDGGTERRSEGASGGSSTPPTVPPSLRGVESPEAARPGAGSVERAQTATDASTDSPAASPPPEPERCVACGGPNDEEWCLRDILGPHRVGEFRHQQGGCLRCASQFHSPPPTGGKE